MKASTKARLYGVGSLTVEEHAEVRAINNAAAARRRDKRRDYDQRYYADNAEKIITGFPPSMEFGISFGWLFQLGYVLPLS